MKRYLILLLAAAALTASCDRQLESVFDENASERMDEHVADVRSRLAAATGGWVMEYYPHPDQTYGGYNILVKFTADGKVEMLDETGADGAAAETSTYDVRRSQGAVLAFDTYNKYICRYATPSTTEGGGLRFGYLGDTEFAVKELADDRIVLKGTKTSNTIVMRKLTGTWAQYLQGVRQMQDNNYYILQYTAIYGDQTQELYIDPKYNKLTYTYKENGADEDAPAVTVGLSFIYTEKGFKFYEPIELFGLKMQNFEWDAANSRMLCVDEGATSAYMQANDVRNTPQFRAYDWFIGTWEFHGATSAGVDQVSTLTVTQKEKNKTLSAKGLKVSSYGLHDQTFTMNWDRTGRVSIVAQSLGEQSVTISSVVYPDIDILLRSSSVSNYGTSTSAGMISKTDMHTDPNRIDFENNGVYTSGVGLRIVIMNVPGKSGWWSGGQWLNPMYMVKKE